MAEGALQGEGFGGEGDGVGLFVAQGVRRWRRMEGAGLGQINLFALLPLLPLSPALQVLHCHT
jgi:hypothetical protein